MKVNGQAVAKPPSPTAAVSQQIASPDSPLLSRDQVMLVTADSVDRPWTYEEEDQEDGSHAAHFKALRAFLRSQLAAEVLPEQAILQMWQEVDEAQSREAYLMDLVRRMKAVANESSEVVEMLEESIPKTPTAAFGTFLT